MNHVGRVENTGRRCLVVFREVYDEKGNVIEPDKCLVVETDTLPDFAHQDLMSIVESEPAQREGEFFNHFLIGIRYTSGFFFEYRVD
jgi:hypothetical protein